jgi:riboflavin synthase
MFTGIIETRGFIRKITKDDDNLIIRVASPITPELKVDQSVAHNGICLTVTNIEADEYEVTAIRETIEKTNIGTWQENKHVNLERAMKFGDRLDGHIVQGHVDQTAECTSIRDAAGSWYFTFRYNSNYNNITIEKGSITVNGVSLTVVNSEKDRFDVAIIPYTFEHTNFKELLVGDTVNLEFDVIGKYVARLFDLRNS